MLRFGGMPTDQILQLLIAERDRLNRAIDALQGGQPRRGRPRSKVVENATDTTASAPARRRKSWTAAQKKAASARMKKRWAAKKKAE